MSKTKHTPGPWHTDAECGHESVLEADGYMVADCAIFGSDKRFTPERSRANARLIAAAPDMLEALRVAQKWLANCVPATEIDGPKPLPMVAAALAKAEGRS